MRYLWQVPLFVAGAAAFVLGVQALVKTIKPVPFETQLKGLELLVEEGDYAKAIEAINRIGEYYKAPHEQAELEVLAGDCHFYAEKKLEEAGEIVRINYERVLDHYKKGVTLGHHPSVAMNERWGIAALAVGEAKIAGERLEAAIADAGEGAHELLEKHGKNLTNAYLEAGMESKALAMVDKLLDAMHAGPDVDQRALELRTWALGKRIEVALANRTADRDTAVARAIRGAREQLESLQQRDLKGRVLTWIARGELDQGARDAAEKDLAAARSLFAVHHVDDGRAALMLAMIKLEKGDLPAAAKLFQDVVVGQAGTTLWAAGRWGRAMTSTQQNLALNETSRGDYRHAVEVVKDGALRAPVGKSPELISQAAVRVSLVDGYRRAVAAKRTTEALEFLEMERGLGGREPPDLLLRFAMTRETLGNEILAEAGKLEGAAAQARELEGRAMIGLAARDYLRHGKLTTLNDEQSGNSLWKAGELLDRAGEPLLAADVYEGLTRMRPRDARVAEGMLALGRLYASAGMLDKAIESHERNIRQNPKAPAAYSSAVDAARTYMVIADRAAATADRDAAYMKGEALLLSLVQDNTDLQPAAREFRESVVTLGRLYYDWSMKIDAGNAQKMPATAPAATAPATNPAPRQYAAARWSDAILRLDEAIKRYGDDPAWEAGPGVRFLLAESYRKSAQEIGAVLERNPAISQRQDLAKARHDRLGLAAQEFARVIGAMDAEAMDPSAIRRKLTPLEQEYLRVAYINRAQCVLERGEVEEAVSLYDRAAARFSEEVIAVQAYVQIVNAYLREGKQSQAAAAAERGRWMLKRIPDSVFEKTTSGANRAYFEKLLSLGSVGP